MSLYEIGNLIETLKDKERDDGSINPLEVIIQMRLACARWVINMIDHTMHKVEGDDPQILLFGIDKGAEEATHLIRDIGMILDHLILAMDGPKLPHAVVQEMTEARRKVMEAREQLVLKQQGVDLEPGTSKSKLN